MFVHISAALVLNDRRSLLTLTTYSLETVSLAWPAKNGRLRKCLLCPTFFKTTPLNLPQVFGSCLTDFINTSQVIARTVVHVPHSLTKLWPREPFFALAEYTVQFLQSHHHRHGHHSLQALSGFLFPSPLNPSQGAD